MVVHFQHVPRAQNYEPDALAPLPIANLLKNEPLVVAALRTRGRTRRQLRNLPQNQQPLTSPNERAKSEDNWNFDKDIELSEDDEDDGSIEINEPEISGQEFIAGLSNRSSGRLCWRRRRNLGITRVGTSSSKELIKGAPGSFRAAEPQINELINLLLILSETQKAFPDLQPVWEHLNGNENQVLIETRDENVHLFSFQRETRAITYQNAKGQTRLVVPKA